MTLNEIFEQESKVILERRGGSKTKHKFPDWQNDGHNKFRPGRERTVSAVINLCAKKGVSLGPGEVRNYIFSMFKAWEKKNQRADWMLKLEERVKKQFGYNPRKYAHIKKGQTAGLSGPGQPEYAGRAYFFTSLINGFANHFTEKEASQKSGGKEETPKKSEGKKDK